MTQELSNNDLAFIKLAKEMRQLQNGIILCESVDKFVTTIRRQSNNYNSADGIVAGTKSVQGYLDTCGGHSNNVPTELAGMSGFIDSLMCGFKNITDYKKTAEKRLAIIGPLLDAYQRGEDVVLTKLAMNGDNTE